MKYCPYLSLSALIIVLHQLMQTWVYGLIEAHGGYIEILPFFNLVEVWNRGVSFGMLSKLAYGKWLLSGMTIIIALIMLRCLWRMKERWTAIALCLVIGGAVGNVIDRIRFGAVADYLDFHAFGYHWPAFNVTDTAICIGVALLILPTLHFKKNKAEAEVDFTT